MYSSFNCTNLLSMLGTGYGSYGSYSGIGGYNLVNSLFSGVDGRSVFATYDNSCCGSSKSSGTGWSTVGWALGIAAVAVGGFMGITALNNNRTQKAQQQTAVNTASNNSKKIETLGKDIKTLEEENKTLEGLEGDVDKNLSKLGTYCKAEVSAYKSAKDDYNSKKSAFDNLDANSAGESKQYKDQIAQLNKDATDSSKTDEQRKAAKDQIDVLEKEWAEEKRKAEKGLSTAETKLNEAKTKLEEVIANKIKANEKAIEKKKADMLKLQEAAEEELSKNTKLSRKCDELDEYKNIMKSDKPSQKDLERAFNYKFREYCNNKTEKKEETRQEAMKVYGELSKNYGANISDEMRLKYDILKNRDKKDLEIKKTEENS